MEQSSFSQRETEREREREKEKERERVRENKNFWQRDKIKMQNKKFYIDLHPSLCSLGKRDFYNVLYKINQNMVGIVVHVVELLGFWWST